METQLKRALERGELTLHYQPKQEIATGLVTGMQALLRWQHPQHGLVPPARFFSRPLPYPQLTQVLTRLLGAQQRPDAPRRDVMFWP